MTENTTPTVPSAESHDAVCPPATSAAPTAGTATSDAQAERAAGAAAPSPEPEPAAAQQPFEPLLTTRDWNAEWKELQKARRHADDATYWDKRSATFGTKDAPNPYVERFLELARILPGETVFDMGCGTGALSVPLGQAGHTVVAADFSAGMLGVLREELDAHGVTSVFPKQMSWEDDWAACGVGAGVGRRVRGLALHRRGRPGRGASAPDRRGAPPRVHHAGNGILAAHRRARAAAPSGCRACWGATTCTPSTSWPPAACKAEAAYIESTRSDTFDSLDEACEDLRAHGGGLRGVRAARRAATPRWRACAPGWKASWSKTSAPACPTGRACPRRALRLRDPRTVTWAFLAWDK